MSKAAVETSLEHGPQSLIDNTNPNIFHIKPFNLKRHLLKISKENTYHYENGNLILLSS